jgi:hypothetical protein
MLASLLTTFLNSTEITQPEQSVSIVATETIECSVVASQPLQSVSVLAYQQLSCNVNVNQPQQSLSSNAFLSINALANIAQPIQFVSIDAVTFIAGQVNVTQQFAQSISIDAFFRHQSTTQATQVTNAQAFIQTNASVSVQQSQSLSATARYYDIAIDASIVQPSQGVLATANQSSQIGAVLEQSKQYMSAVCVNGVFIAQSADKVFNTNQYRILRKIRNSGRR